MFNNAGKSLMKFAKINMICSYILAALCAIGGIFFEDILIFVIGIGAGLIWILIGYYTSLVIYGLGQLVDDVREIKEKTGVAPVQPAALFEELPDL